MGRLASLACLLLLLAACAAEDPSGPAEVTFEFRDATTSEPVAGEMTLSVVASQTDGWSDVCWNTASGACTMEVPEGTVMLELGGEEGAPQFDRWGECDGAKSADLSANGEPFGTIEIDGNEVTCTAFFR